MDDPTERLFLDAREVRDRTRLRLIATLPAMAGGVWLCWISDSWFLRAFALAGVTFGALWLLSARRGAAQLQTASEHYLDIGQEALQVCSGPGHRTLPWSEILAVEIDEDRLVTVLRLRGGDTLAIEPQYGQLALEALAERLERARKQAQACGVGAGETPGMRSRQQ